MHRRVGVNASRHSKESHDMHGKESYVEADKRKPEAEMPELGKKRAAGELRDPVIHARHDWEYRTADQHVMKMGHHKVRVVYLPIKRDDCHHHARHAA